MLPPVRRRPLAHKPCVLHRRARYFQRAKAQSVQTRRLMNPTTASP
jgi:hypothetical protein